MTFLIEVDGVALPDDVAAMLTYARVDDDTGLPAMFTLRFGDPQQAALDKAGLRIGAEVSVRVPVPGRPARTLTDGEVTSVEREFGPGGTTTEVRGLDATHRLQGARRVVAYLGMSVSEIVAAIAARAGLRAVPVAETGAAARAAWDGQLSQDDVTDWEFLLRLGDLFGARPAVVAGALHFAPADDGAEPLPLAARSLLALRATRSRPAAGAVAAHAWDLTTKRAVQATEPVPGTAGGVEQRVGGVAHRPDLVRVAAEAAAARAAAAVELEGLAEGDPALRPGVAVELVDAGEPFEGRHVLTGVRHTFDAQAGYTTAFTVARPTPAPRPPGPVRGLVPAVVGDVRDPLGLGRVRLILPWLAPGYTTGWARTVQPGAGPGRGALVLPEVGDEVLAGFAGDDLDAPYVVGGLHNGADPVPQLSREPVDPVSGAVAVRGFVSRHGHRVELIEDGGVLIATAGGAATVRLDSVTGAVHVSGRGVTLDAGAGDLTLRGRRVSVEADADAEITANGQAVVRAAVIRLN
ncbi:VgrG-related protein [Dactylosporangium sp. NPDC006015]|uniref:VgrG-related protein n=1 Tax=Dactylosporangium sp. NPDC006015 TaxID=3154576 RepID=UPI0033B974C3